MKTVKSYRFLIESVRASGSRSCSCRRRTDHKTLLGNRLSVWQQGPRIPEMLDYNKTTNKYLVYALFVFHEHCLLTQGDVIISELTTESYLTKHLIINKTLYMSMCICGLRTFMILFWIVADSARELNTHSIEHISAWDIPDNCDCCTETLINIHLHGTTQKTVIAVHRLYWTYICMRHPRQLRLP